MRTLVVLLLLTTIGCFGKREIVPADRVKNHKFFFECCNPALSPSTKELCDLARGTKGRVLVDEDKNQYIFIWSDCTPGEEKWRKWQ